MADEQDQAEMVDEDELSAQEVGTDALPAEDLEFAPDKPPGAQAYGAAGADPGAPEGVYERSAREQPEVADDDRIVGDGSTGWGQPAAPPAEEAAMHVLDEGLADFDSEVDDPELEAAWETDPEVGRADR